MSFEQAGPGRTTHELPELGDLTLLVSAVAGRRAEIHVARDSGLRHAYSDGQAIVLPAEAAASGDAWMYAISQALLMAADSLSPAVLRRLLARPAAARRYAWLEVQRAESLLRDRIPPRYVRALHNAGSSLSTVKALNASDSATRALSNDKTPQADSIPAFVGTVRPMAVLRKAASPNGMGTPRPGQLGRGLGVEETIAGSRILQVLRSTVSGKHPTSTLLDGLARTGANPSWRPAARGGQDGEEVPIGRIEQAWRRGTRAVRDFLPFDGPDSGEPHVTAGRLYPEWDGALMRYRRDWVCVEEVAPWRPDGPRQLDSRLAVPPTRLRRELSRLPLDAAMQRRQRDGPEFDVGALIDHAAQRRVGSSSDTPAVYRASRRTCRDLGVVVVMDASSSTEERNARGESVFDHQAAAALRIARTFDSLGDRVALYGFHSWGRRRVHLVRLKRHEEAWSGQVSSRLSQLDAVGFTRTGAAVRHADRLLRTEIRLPHRLMVLITDGLAYDGGYEGVYAEDDTRRALAEARAQGTASVCLCIGGSVNAAALVRVFGAAHLLMVDDSRLLDGRLRAVCARALAGVSRRRPMSAATALNLPTSRTAAPA